jgi:hypothetical protein
VPLTSPRFCVRVLQAVGKRRDIHVPSTAVVLSSIGTDELWIGSRVPRWKCYPHGLYDLIRSRAGALATGSLVLPIPRIHGCPCQVGRSTEHHKSLVLFYVDHCHNEDYLVSPDHKHRLPRSFKLFHGLCRSEYTTAGNRCSHCQVFRAITHKEDEGIT